MIASGSYAIVTGAWALRAFEADVGGRRMIDQPRVARNIDDEIGTKARAGVPMLEAMSGADLTRLSGSDGTRRCTRSLTFERMSRLRPVPLSP